MRTCRSIWFLLCCCVGVAILGHPGPSWADSEFTRVRRIYIEGARFMQEKRYVDAIPMLAQAYNLLTRAIKRGSRSKRTLRATIKLRYFLGFCHYQVGSKKSSGKSKEDKAFTRSHYEKAVPLFEQYIKEAKSETRRKRSVKLLATIKPWLLANPKPKIKPKIIVRPLKPKKGKLRAWPFVVLGVGLAVAIGGTITAVLTLSDVSQRDKIHQTLSNSGEALSDLAAKEVARFHRQAETMATLSYALWAAGGTITAAGLVLILVAGRAPPPKTTLPKPPSKHAKSFLLQGGLLP